MTVIKQYDLIQSVEDALQYISFYHPPDFVKALAEAWSELYRMDAGERRTLGMAARERIAASYDLRSIVRRYEQLYDELAARGPEG